MATNGSIETGPDASIPPRAFTPGSQRERLLDGVARAVAQRGYPATPVAEILVIAGVSRRTFYEQFVDKEDCFLTAYDLIVRLCTERLVAGYHAGADWRDGIARAYRALLGTLAAEPAFAHLGVVDIVAAGPSGIARRDATLRRFARFLDHTRERIDTDVRVPAVATRAIVGGIHELVHARVVAGEAARLPELADDVVHYTMTLLGSSGEGT